MEKAELDRLAWAGSELPSGLGYTDTLYFLMLRALYRYAKETNMEAEKGRLEKAKISDAVRQYKADQDITRHCAELMRDTGAARAEYRKARNAMQGAELYLPPEVIAVIAAGDNIVEILDNIPIGGESNNT